MGAIGKGLGTVLQHAGKFAGRVGNVFKTVTEGVSKFFTEVGRGAINQITGGATQNFSVDPVTLKQAGNLTLNLLLIT